MNNQVHSDVSTTIRASVCMATYNGAKYIAEQIESILAQLGSNDELIIVDDASPDDTVERIRAYDDSRLTLLEAPQNQGYVKSFEQGVLASSGEFVFLADQDDVWLDGRLDMMISALRNSDVVATNFEVLGGGSRGVVRVLRSIDSTHYIRNLIGIMVGYRPYYGCGMAMTRNQAAIFAPVPTYLKESHDLWLAICGNVGKSISHLDEPSLLRRLHENNVTPRGWRPLPVILRARLMILRCMVEAARRSRANRKTRTEAIVRFN